MLLGKVSIDEQGIVSLESKPSLEFNAFTSAKGPYIAVVPLSTIAEHPFEQISKPVLTVILLFIYLNSFNLKSLNIKKRIFLLFHIKFPI